MQYRGANGSRGVGTIAIGNGAVVGTDLEGARYDGTYTHAGGRLRGNLVLKVPAGTQLVTGHAVEAATDIPVAFDLPVPFDGGGEHEIQVAGQPVWIAFQRIQDWP
jgi:hypothetical protein